MSKTIIQELVEFGQSIWLDYISRPLIDSGSLEKLIDQGLRGMTSNPSIFDKAVSSSNDYDKKIQVFHKTGKSIFEIYDDITIKDIQDAADLLRPIYKKTNRSDGYVSLEINPKLAYQTEETIEEGKRLFKKVSRPNVMLKVPSTEEGFAAIEALLAEGININITLIFSLEQYIKTTESYIRGINKLLMKNGDISKVCSVASDFVSRIDTMVDTMLDERLGKETDAAIKNRLKQLKGKAAVANSALLYKNYIDIFSGEEFKKLQKQGANIQKLLWGSTSTKNPAYSDIKYVTELIGKGTVNTIPEKTLNAFLDHGIVREALTGDIQEAQKIIHDLKGFDIDINDVCRKLLEDGVIAFEKSFDSLLRSIEEKAKAMTA
jgi:transaldolase